VIVARVASDALAAAPARADAPRAFVAPPKRVALLDVEAPAIIRAHTTPILVAPRLRPWTLGARLSGLSGIGIIPQVGLGAELAVTLRAGSHLAELGGARWMASAAEFDVAGSSPVDVNLDVAIARYGWRPTAMPLRAWMAIEVGNMRGIGVRPPNEPDDTGRWLAAGGGFGIAWQMTSWVRLVGTTEVLLAIERARFGMSDGTIVYAPAPMSVRTSCGLEVGWQ
jgi:hypothetical protein